MFVYGQRQMNYGSLVNKFLIEYYIICYFKPCSNCEGVFKQTLNGFTCSDAVGELCKDLGFVGMIVNVSG